MSVSSWRSGLAQALARSSDRVVRRLDPAAGSSAELGAGPSAPPAPAAPARPDRAPTRPDALRPDMPDIEWRERDGERASYRYKLHESKRRKNLLNLHDHRQRIWAFNDKNAGRRFAASLDVAVPEVFVESGLIDRIDWDDLPERFVLKPLSGAANRGVYLLERDGDGFVDQMTDRRLGVDDVLAETSTAVEARLVSPHFSVEELLVPRPELRGHVSHPDDFKVFTFWDRPAIVMQRRMGDSRRPATWRFRLWNDRWEDLGPVKNADRVDPTLERPAGAAEILEVAARVGAELAVPFVRLDVYDTERGVVFGEVSPHPGPPEHWSPEIDELLGREWELAEAGLMAAGIAPNEPRP